MSFELDGFLNLLKSFLKSDNCGVCLKLGQVCLRLFNVACGVIWGIVEQFVEQVSTPLNAVLNLVGEISESTHGNGFFGRILGIPIALGFEGNDHLGVCFGTKGSRLQKRLAVPDASLVYIETSFDVVDSVDHEV